MNAIVRFCRKHWLSIGCHIALLAIWFYALWARANDHGLYGPDNQMNAVPLEKAFYGLIYFILASVVLLLIALSKLIFGKENKIYYAIYAGLITAQMLLTWIYIVVS